MLSELLSFLTNFASNLGTTQLIVILAIMVIFIVFLFMAKKIIKTLFNMVWITIASAVFPFVMNFVFGFSIPLKIDTVLFFVILGLGLYFLYIIGKLIYFALGLAEKSAKVAIYPITARSQGKKRERNEKLDKLLKKEEEEEEKREKARKKQKRKKRNKSRN